jgi:glutathione S-transferase
MSTPTAADQVGAAREQLGEALLRLHGYPEIATAEDLTAVDTVLFRVGEAMELAREALWAAHPALEAELNRRARSAARRMVKSRQMRGPLAGGSTLAG